VARRVKNAGFPVGRGGGLGKTIADLISEARPRTAGLDLSGSEERPSGWALLEGLRVRTRLLKSDSEILELTCRSGPELVAIDAPLTWPKEGYMRDVDRLMHKIGLPVLPPLFPAMRMLTARGIRLAKALRARGLRVIEVHPASTRKVLGLPVKGRKAIQDALLGLGLRGDIEERRLTVHELDAITAALTASLHVLGVSELVRTEDGEICIPRRELSLAR